MDGYPACGTDDQSWSIRDALGISKLVGPRPHLLAIVQLDGHFFPQVEAGPPAGTVSFDPICDRQGSFINVKGNPFDNAVTGYERWKRAKIN
jgi:hypothetical protein